MKHYIATAAICFCIYLLAGCDKNRVYEKSNSIPDYIWSNDNNITFEVNIPDTSVLYNLYINVRHTDWYPFSNIWVLIYTTYPSREKKEDRVELVLGEKDAWHGDGMGDIWDIKIPIQENVYFPEIGIYKFEIEQNMREPKIPGIMNIGLRIEKTEQSKN